MVYKVGSRERRDCMQIKVTVETFWYKQEGSNLVVVFEFKVDILEVFWWLQVKGYDREKQMAALSAKI